MAGQPASHGFCPGAAPGCHVVHATDRPAWLFGREPFDADEYEAEDVARMPDIAVDPDEGVLTVINTRPDAAMTYYITTVLSAVGADQRPLQAGSWRDEGGRTRECTTFVVVAPPATETYVCRLLLPPGWAGWADGELCSDVQPFHRHPDPGPPIDAAPPLTLAFPFGGPTPRLCTQGFGGRFTHFFAGTHHAVDFRCAVGTPLLAAGDGTVLEVRQDNDVSGIHVRNLFAWNSLLLRLDPDGRAGGGAVYVEYVHIKQGSVRLAAGDRVRAGDVLCLSGDVGFCPEPHLHLQAHASRDADAPTVPFRLRAADGTTFLPEAGRLYSAATGPVA